MFDITERPIDLAPLIQAVADPRAGAVVTFLGTTRNENGGRRVLRLEYEAFATMAKREMRALAVAAGCRWPARKVAMAHRIGVVPVGEASVAIVVSAAHRAEAFDACHWLIDRLKEIVPIWKKEHFRGGELWIGPQQGRPPVRRATAARRRRRSRPRRTPR